MTTSYTYSDIVDILYSWIYNKCENLVDNYADFPDSLKPSYLSSVALEKDCIDISDFETTGQYMSTNDLGWPYCEITTKSGIESVESRAVIQHFNSFVLAALFKLANSPTTSGMISLLNLITQFCVNNFVYVQSYIEPKLHLVYQKNANLASNVEIFDYETVLLHSPIEYIIQALSEGVRKNSRIITVTYNFKPYWNKEKLKYKVTYENNDLVVYDVLTLNGEDIGSGKYVDEGTVIKVNVTPIEHADPNLDVYISSIGGTFNTQISVGTDPGNPGNYLISSGTGTMTFALDSLYTTFALCGDVQLCCATKKKYNFLTYHLISSDVNDLYDIELCTYVDNKVDKFRKYSLLNPYEIFSDIFDSSEYTFKGWISNFESADYIYGTTILSGYLLRKKNEDGSFVLPVLYDYITQNINYTYASGDMIPGLSLDYLSYEELPEPPKPPLQADISGDIYCRIVSTYRTITYMKAPGIYGEETNYYDRINVDSPYRLLTYAACGFDYSHDPFHFVNWQGREIDLSLLHAKDEISDYEENYLFLNAREVPDEICALISSNYLSINYVNDSRIITQGEFPSNYIDNNVLILHYGSYQVLNLDNYFGIDQDRVKFVDWSGYVYDDPDPEDPELQHLIYLSDMIDYENFKNLSSTHYTLLGTYTDTTFIGVNDVRPNIMIGKWDDMYYTIDYSRYDSYPGGTHVTCDAYEPGYGLIVVQNLDNKLLNNSELGKKDFKHWIGYLKGYIPKSPDLPSEASAIYNAGDIIGVNDNRPSCMLGIWDDIEYELSDYIYVQQDVGTYQYEKTEYDDVPYKNYGSYIIQNKLATYGYSTTNYELLSIDAELYKWKDTNIGRQFDSSQLTHYISTDLPINFYDGSEYRPVKLSTYIQKKVVKHTLVISYHTMFGYELDVYHNTNVEYDYNASNPNEVLTYVLLKSPSLYENTTFNGWKLTYGTGINASISANEFKTKHEIKYTDETKKIHLSADITYNYAEAYLSINNTHVLNGIHNPPNNYSELGFDGDNGGSHKWTVPLINKTGWLYLGFNSNASGTGDYAASIVYNGNTYNKNNVPAKSVFYKYNSYFISVDVEVDPNGNNYLETYVASPEEGDPNYVTWCIALKYQLNGSYAPSSQEKTVKITFKAIRIQYESNKFIDTSYEYTATYYFRIGYGSDSEINLRENGWMPINAYDIANDYILDSWYATENKMNNANYIYPFDQYKLNLLDTTTLAEDITFEAQYRTLTCTNINLILKANGGSFVNSSGTTTTDYTYNNLCSYYYDNKTLSHYYKDTSKEIFACKNMTMKLYHKNCAQLSQLYFNDCILTGWTYDSCKDIDSNLTASTTGNYLNTNYYLNITANYIKPELETKLTEIYYKPLTANYSTKTFKLILNRNYGTWTLPDGGTSTANLTAEYNYYCYTHNSNKYYVYILENKLLINKLKLTDIKDTIYTKIYKQDNELTGWNITCNNSVNASINIDSSANKYKLLKISIGDTNGYIGTNMLTALTATAQWKTYTLKSIILNRNSGTWTLPDGGTSTANLTSKNKFYTYNDSSTQYYIYDYNSSNDTYLKRSTALTVNLGVDYSSITYDKHALYGWNLNLANTYLSYNNKNKELVIGYSGYLPSNANIQLTASWINDVQITLNRNYGTWTLPDGGTSTANLTAHNKVYYKSSYIYDCNDSTGLYDKKCQVTVSLSDIYSSISRDGYTLTGWSLYPNDSTYLSYNKAEKLLTVGRSSDGYFPYSTIGLTAQWQ